MTKEREAEIRAVIRDDFRHFTIRYAQEMLAEIDRLRQENADRYDLLKKYESSELQLPTMTKNKLTKAREALRHIYVSYAICQPIVRQALKETE